MRAQQIALWLTYAAALGAVWADLFIFRPL